MHSLTGLDFTTVITTITIGNDTIMDYEAGLDIITVNNGLTVVGIADDAGNAEVTLSSGDLITVVGVSSGNIEVVDLTAPTT